MEFADRAFIRLHILGSKLPGFVATAVLKSLFNSWNTTRRYRCGAVGCRFGCQAVGGDDILRYMVCPIAIGAVRNSYRLLPDDYG
eukprot:5185971-Pyramimonas_sp.AAC.1